ncbi:MAG: DUF3885 domain-containing protein [Colwellia sp.]|nr:DUF3885 domain-containing protein [Colwellia sp.]
MNQYFDEHFSGLKLQKPLFYNWPIGLRFEIGPDEIELWKDSERETINEKYFEISLVRAVSIFEAVFGKDDDIEIIYQQYSDGRKKIRKGNFIFKQINAAKISQVKSVDVRNIYELDYKSECWKRLNIPNLSVDDINYKNILLSLIHTDFGCRKPSMWGECFIINKTKSIILNLYDDRGMDVISSNREALIPLYQSHNEWLLNYDRERMDLVFS